MPGSVEMIRHGRNPPPAMETCVACGWAVAEEHVRYCTTCEDPLHYGCAAVRNGTCQRCAGGRGARCQTPTWDTLDGLLGNEAGRTSW